jgi:hypothetical protein
LVCTCKKALISVEKEDSKSEADVIDFGKVIFGEQATRSLRIVNKGALPTKITVKSNDGKTIPIFSMEDLRKREELERFERERREKKEAK